MGNMENVLFADDNAWNDPDEKNPRSYHHYLNVDSFVDYFLHTELVASVDAYTKNVYAYYDGDKDAKDGILPYLLFHPICIITTPSPHKQATTENCTWDLLPSLLLAWATLGRIQIPAMVEARTVMVPACSLSWWLCVPIQSFKFFLALSIACASCDRFPFP